MWPGAWSFPDLPEEPDPPVCWVRNLRVNQKTNPLWLSVAPACVQPSRAGSHQGAAGRGANPLKA